jgi:hypothetical protein
MAYLIPNEGELRLLNEALDGGLTRENWTLVLFKSNTTPAEADTVATYTPVTSADWPGYADVTLTRTVSGATWNTPANGTPTNAWSAESSVAESAYGASPQSFTNNHASNVVTVYGYLIKGATSSKLIAAETFAAPRTLNPNDVLQFTPRFGFA